MVHLVTGCCWSVAVEKRVEGSSFVARGRGDGDEGGHFFGAVSVPSVEKFEEAGPLVEVFGGVHWLGEGTVSLLPFS
jgi:hypothetical protein